MPDNLKDIGPQDATRINPNETREVAYWTKALGCGKEELENAVKAGSNSAEAIRGFLRK